MHANFAVYVDHNVAARALSLIGGAENTRDITDVIQTGNACVEALRAAVREAVAGRARLVTSEYGLESLRRLLTSGTDDIEPLDPESVNETLAVLHTVSEMSGGYASSEMLADRLPDAGRATLGNIGHDHAMVDYEDQTVIASIFAHYERYFDGALDGNSLTSVLVTHDVGFLSCERSLNRKNVAVLSAKRWVTTLARPSFAAAA